MKKCIALFTQEREYAFVPHLTIGQGLSDAEHADVLADYV